ncbi:MAG: anti-sigma factor [Actinomycetota bacterium]|nr:anti-sigma factor [Actinomycetota bacterium]
MMRDHTLIEELLSVQALGGLDGGDVALLESQRSEHGDCVECRNLEDEFNEIAGRLGFALDPEPIDPRMADEILLRARSSEDVAIQPVRVESIDVARDRLSTRRGRWSSNWTAVAATIAVLLIFGTIAIIRSGGTTPVGTVASAQQFVRFTGTGGADVVMAYAPGKTGVVLLGSGLPDPGPGKVFELWTIRDQTPLSAGCTTATNGGIAAALPASPVGGDLMAVTIESTSCPSAPTTTPILTAQLS